MSNPIDDMVERLPPHIQAQVRQGMLWNIRCALNYARQQKQEEENLNEFAKELESQSVEWGAF